MNNVELYPKASSWAKIMWNNQSLKHAACENKHYHMRHLGFRVGRKGFTDIAEQYGDLYGRAILNSSTVLVMCNMSRMYDDVLICGISLHSPQEMKLTS